MAKVEKVEKIENFKIIEEAIKVIKELKKENIKLKEWCTKHISSGKRVDMTRWGWPWVCC